MMKLRTRFERFCFRNRDKGIPNLMLYITLTTAVIYLFEFATQSTILTQWLCFDRQLILQGQVWRLFSYALLGRSNNIIMTAVMLICYYSLGSAIEQAWGTCKFNLFYFCGILLMDIYCMVFGGASSVTYLHLSLFLGYATMYPDTKFLIYFVIPIKAWVLALIYLVITLFGLLFSAFPLVALGNYFLFFGKDVKNVFRPMVNSEFGWRIRKSVEEITPRKQKPKAQPKVIPFPNDQSVTKEPVPPKPRMPYTHRCTVCGRTDTEYPDLEFRYCSRCQGYHCYCEDHISNHTHVQ